MGAHVAALIVEEFVVDREEAAIAVDGGAQLVTLLARMIGRDQMLAPVLDPFHRPAEPQRGETNQHVLGIKLAANTEPSAHVAFEEMHARRAAAEHAGDVVAVPVRNFGGAVELQHVARGVVMSDRAARLQRNAGMAPDREVQLDYDRGVVKRGRELAIGLFHDRRFGRTSGLEFPWRFARVEHEGQIFDLDRDYVGGILGQIWIAREHRRHGLADIAHALTGQDWLPVRHQSFDSGQAKIDRRNLGDVGRRPHRRHARQRQRGSGVD